MSGSREIKITIIGDASKAKTAFEQTGTSAQTFEGKVTGLSSKFSNFGSVVSGVIAAGAIQKVGGFLISGAQGAMDDSAAMDRLKTSIENTGTSFASHSAAIDDAIKKGQALAFSDGDIMDALTNLTNATGDSDEALRRLGLAQDLARGTGMTLEQASKLLGKTSDENTATLKRYGVVLDDNATAQDVMNEVDKRFGGQAAAFAESDAGKWAKMQDQMTELQETIGGMLIPAFTLLATTLSSVFTALEPVTKFIGDNLTPIMIGLAAAITVIVIPAFIAWATAAAAAAAATIVAMAPVIAIAAAIGIAVAALYLAWSTNFLGIQDITKQVMDFIMPYITTALDAIQTAFETVWPIIDAIIQFYLAAWQLIFQTAWDVIKAVFETVFPIIQGIVETYIAAWSAIISTGMAVIQAVFQTVWPIIQGIVEVAMTAIQTAVQVGMFLVKDIIGPILGAIQELFQTTWDAIQTIIDTIAGPAGTIVTVVTDGINGVKSAISTVLDEIKIIWDTAWNGLKGTVQTVVDTIKRIVSGVIGAVNGVIGSMNSALEFHIPGLSVGGHTIIPDINFNPPDIPYIGNPFAAGGGGGSEPKAAHHPLVGGFGAVTAGGSHLPSGTLLPGYSPTGGEYPPSAYAGGQCPAGTSLGADGLCHEPEYGGGTGNIGGPNGLPGMSVQIARAGGPAGGKGGPHHMDHPDTDASGRTKDNPWYGSDPNAENIVYNQLLLLGYSGLEAAALVSQGPTAAHAALNNPHGAGAPRLAGDLYSQGGNLSSFMAGQYTQGGQSLRFTDPAAYAARVGGVLLKSGLIGYANVGGGSAGDVYIDGHRAGIHIGAANMRGKFHRKKLSPNPC